jgi:short-subunit dehydrogenase
MLGTKTAAGEMLKQGWGKIFNMEGFGSDGRIMNKMSLYGTTKRALNYFSKSVSAELEGTPVQLGILSPGMVRTDFLKNTSDPRTKEEAKQFDKVFRFLAEDPEKITRFLSERLLRSSKQYDRIEFLTKGRLMVKLIRMMLNK